MSVRGTWLLLSLGILACEGGTAGDVDPQTGGTAATGGGPAEGTGAGGEPTTGGAPTTGGITGSGGACDDDPEERCSVPIEMCSGGFCESVCEDYFYCQDGSVFWVSCLGMPLYACPAGCEEKKTSDGRRIYTNTEADVCNPAAGGTSGLGGAGD